MTFKLRLTVVQFTHRDSQTLEKKSHHAPYWVKVKVKVVYQLTYYTICFCDKNARQRGTQLSVGPSTLFIHIQLSKQF